MKKIIRVFPHRTKYTPTDEFAFVGEPPMFRPPADRVNVSVTFTWDIAEAVRLTKSWKRYYQDVQLGGPAIGSKANGFIPGMYIKPGVVFTSRGCNNNCPWCLVPAHEGKIQELEFPSGNIIQDNNILQCSRKHQELVISMLKHQHQVSFSGGLDGNLLTDRFVDELRGLSINQLFVAADTEASLKPLRKAAAMLKAFPMNKLRCYVLIGYGGETIEKAKARLIAVLETGFLTFAQLYQPPDIKRQEYAPAWRRLVWEWSRPAVMKSRIEAKNAK